MSENSEKNNKKVDKDRRELLKKLGLTAGGTALGAGLLGYQVGTVRAVGSTPTEVTGDSIDVESVNAEQLSIIEGDYKWKQDLLVSYEDTDTNSVLDYDTGSGGLDVHDFYKVIMVLGGQEVGLTTVNIRVNGYSIGNYRYNYIDSGSLGSVSGASQWQEGFDGEGKVMFGYLISGRHTPSAMTRDSVSISGAWGVGDDTKQHIINGFLHADMSDVDQLRIWTDANVIGKLSVVGVDIR